MHPKNLQRRIDAFGDLLDLHRLDGENTEKYLAYLKKGRRDQKLVADVTPAYGLLSPDRFARMAAISENVRFLYILRDPVSRLWSHIRMLASQGADTPSRIQEMATQIFWRFGRGRFQAIHERGDYAMTLGNLDKVLGPGQLFTVYYEELFNSKTLRRICEFLGIGDTSVAGLDEAVHVGPQARMSNDMVAKAQEWLAPQYEFVKRWSGYLPPEWQENAPDTRAIGIRMLGVNT